jgi:EmrB/QacA subfamily drug resistance transporter
MSSDTTSSSDDRLDPALIKLGLTVVVGAFASLLDSTIVSIAINTFARDFHTSLSTIQWVMTGYLLALSMVIPLTGWSIARFGRKTMWMVSLSLFMGASVLSGLAWSAGSLIAFRVLQGLGGGMILPIAQTIIVQAAGPKRIGRMMGIIAVPSQLAPVIGPLVGGVIVANASWRWLFFINVPICLIGLALSVRYVPGDTGRAAQKLDVLGLALLSPGLAGVVYGLSQSATLGFANQGVLIWLIAGLALIAAYVVHALRTKLAAIIDVHLFRYRSFSIASILMFLFGLSLFGVMFLLPLLYTQAYGNSALRAGLLLAPQGAGALLAFFVVGKLADRFDGRPIILICLAIATLGTIPYLFIGAHVNDALLGISLFVRGIGLGGVNIPLNTVAFQGLERPAIPGASSAVNIIMRIGGSFGTAVLAVVLQRQFADHAASTAGRAAAFATTFGWTLVFTAAALIPALFVPRRPRPAVAAPSPQPAPAGRGSS